MTDPNAAPDALPIAGPFNIMAKPVCGVCNLDCAYCYYTCKMQLYPPGSTFMMTDEVLESHVRQYLAAQDVQVSFGWQGGEPLLAGLEFFRKVVALQRQYARPGQQVSNALQTNGTLITDEWAAFLAENNFLVGLSLDGPPAWHDHFRRDRNGEGSFARAWAGLETLRRHNVEFNVLVTLNSRNAAYGGDIYRYFVNRDVRWMQFIPILEKNPDGTPTDYSCTPGQFGRFLCEVFDEWADKHLTTVSVRQFDSFLHTLVHGCATTCCESPRCAAAYVLEFNGDLYACDHFVEPQWKLGNITEVPLTDLLRSPKLEEFARLKTEMPGDCQGCRYQRLCYGGCPKHHLTVDDAGAPTARHNHFCEGYRVFLDHALPELERLAGYVRQGRTPPPRNAVEADAAQQRRQESAVRRPGPLPNAPPGRNDPCPCGSGRKFKRCCGR